MSALFVRSAYELGSIVFSAGTTDPMIIGQDGEPHRLVSGWYLVTDYGQDDDGFYKASHTAVSSRTGEEIDLNWSPYDAYADRHFDAMVEMGFPVSERLFADNIDARLAAFRRKR
jgi:hypothetical protein